MSRASRAYRRQSASNSSTVSFELLEYVFAGLLNAELTQKQNVLFRYTLRLMLAVPNATIIDLVRFLSDSTPYL